MSKILDANSEPKVVYHRTHNNFTKFDKEQIFDAVTKQRDDEVMALMKEMRAKYGVNTN